MTTPLRPGPPLRFGTLPIGSYLLVNHSGPAAHGWGIVMSSDTAFVLGILALFGPRCPDQLRLFLLALAVVDDIGAISVMAVFYTEDVRVAALLVAALLLLLFPLLRWLGVGGPMSSGVRPGLLLRDHP